MNDTRATLTRFVSVVAQGQSYLNILYLLLSFPLGLFYFVFLVAGLSLGLGLAIVWVGIPILLFMMAAWWALAALERQLAILMLHEDIAPMSRYEEAGGGAWRRFLAHLQNPVTWKSLGYLFARFPLGILCFTVAVTLTALSLGMILAPVIYPFVRLSFGPWQVHSLVWAIPVSLLGVVVWPASLHIMNALALISGRFASLMLGAAPAQA